MLWNFFIGCDWKKREVDHFWKRLRYAWRYRCTGLYSRTLRYVTSLVRTRHLLLKSNFSFLFYCCIIHTCIHTYIHWYLYKCYVYTSHHIFMYWMCIYKCMNLIHMYNVLCIMYYVWIIMCYVYYVLCILCIMCYVYYVYYVWFTMCNVYRV